MERLKKCSWLLLCVLLCSFVVTGGLVLVQNPVQIEAASKPKLNKTRAYVTKGESLQLSVSKAKGKIRWSSSRKSIVKVSTKGKVTGVKKGTATVTALVGGKKYNCKVTVETPSISSKSISLEEGDSTDLTMRGTKQKVSWSSSNKNVATVSKSGIVYGKSTGTARVTAKVGNKKYTCNVKVLPGEEPEQPKISYMGDFLVKQNATTGEQEILFSFLLQDKITRVASSGTAAIKIVSDSGAEVYNKSVPFSQQNFSYWSDYNSGNRYLCCIRIPSTEIQKGKVTSGVLTMRITLDNGIYFNDVTSKVFGLPEFALEDLYKMELPELPKSIGTYYSSGRLDKSCNILSQNLTWKRSSENEARAVISVTGIKTYDTYGNNKSSTMQIPWKLYKDGVVVDSGYFYSKSVAVGETFTVEFNIFNLKEGDYKLEYLNLVY